MGDGSGGQRAKPTFICGERLFSWVRNIFKTPPKRRVELNAPVPQNIFIFLDF